MIRNRSVPADTVLPHIICQNVVDALDWLTGTFGFTDLTVFVNDVDAHYERTKSAGAKIVEELSYRDF
jgi:uncharacterized glyoxalase superfamily protein PhnB